ncbi:MAG: ABC transporter ATP-binding protein [Ardenticatenales bacterium]|nr:ABC transporter ATP-binding protein [Ardenticatenales bacterium]
MAEFTVELPYPSDHRTPARWLWSHMRRHPLFIGMMLLGAFGNAALAALIPILIGLAFAAALQEPAPDLGRIGQLAIWMVISQAVRAVLQFGRNFFAEAIGRRLERDTRNELYASLIGKSMTFHDLNPVGDIMARATNDVYEIHLLVAPGVNLVVGSANFLIMPLILGPTYHPSLIAAPLFFVLTYFLALNRYLRILNPITEWVRRSFGIMNSRLAESIDGIETVKAASQELQEIQLFQTNAGDYRDASVAQGKQEARFLPLLLLGLTNAIGFTQAMWLFQQGAIEVSDVVAYMGLLTLFGFPTFISLTAYSQISRGLASARRILDIIMTSNKLDENTEGHQAEISGRIRFDNIAFGYVDDVDVLGDISFAVEPGQTVALVGQTGAGKSSIAKLINRTYDVRQGRVLVDDVDVRDWSLAALRQQISIIEQDIFLFSRTIAENIAFGNPDATREQVIAAAKDAQAHDFILNFKDGYDTVIGERGVTLSGGQRQRLALARAFLTRPRILILDDSTSAVDSATEDLIQKAIARAASGQTTILITHRLSQIRWADLVVVLRGGRLEAVGSHEELMANYPAYQQIFA